MEPIARQTKGSCERETCIGVPRDVVYALLDPDTQEVRYVGKTRSPLTRLTQHGRDAKRKDTALYRWWNRLIRDGRGLPVLAVLATSIDDEWEELERLMIAQHRADGADLLNMARGGRQPSKTPEQRAERGRECARQVHHGDPMARRVWELKKFFGAELRRLEKLGRTDRIEELRAKLSLAAVKAPAIWGCYA